MKKVRLQLKNLCLLLGLAVFVISVPVSCISQGDKNSVMIDNSEPELELKNSFMGTVTLPGNVSLEMVKIKAGRFQMGSPESEKGREDDESLHWVTLTRDYWIGKYEVTQAQYQAVMGTNPSYFKGDDRPVDQVGWNDAMAFCRKLNELTAGKRPAGYEYGLPTEAQWEYACRAGTATSLNSGMDMKILGRNNAPLLDAVGWYGGNCGRDFHCEQSHDISGWKEKQYNDTKGGSHPVGQKRPNAWGLYDMHGNVWEWCRDWYETGYAEDPEFLRGQKTGSNRVNRGGGWYDDAGDCRAAIRGYGDQSYSSNCLGFRLALIPAQ